MSGDVPKLKIAFGSSQEFAAEWEKNISKGGIFLQADPPPPVRQRVAVIIEIGEAGKNFWLDGETVYVTPQGVGVQLDPISQQIREDIERLLNAPEQKAQLPEVKAVEESNDSGDEEEAGSGQNLHEEIKNLSRHDKMSLARKGGRSERSILLRDRDPQIVTNVLLNPRVGIGEVLAISKSNSITLDIIKRITGTSEWISNEDVRFNLALNPKTPLPVALGLLKRLSDKNIRKIAKRPLKQQIKAAAIRILSK